jgi:hypothetical protein
VPDEHVTGLSLRTPRLVTYIHAPLPASAGTTRVRVHVVVPSAHSHVRPSGAVKACASAVASAHTPTNIATRSRCIFVVVI